MTARPPESIRSTVLPGGLRVVTEWVPAVRSATLGVWVGVGSRDEQPGLAGVSHFLEHLLFKGTGRRDALEIASVMDAVGGELNAFTAQEYTCYHARVVDTDLPLAVDVVGDLVTGATCDPADVESERGVIVEEIAMHDDEPGDVVHEAFARALYAGHPLGRPVTGTQESVSALPAPAVAEFYRRHYTPDRMVVAAAGNLEHDRVVDLVRAAIGTGGDAGPAALRPTAPAPAVSAGVVVEDRPSEQAHLVLGTHGLPRSDERSWALSLLSAALGGGMSSRLFQEVREKRGLAYSVYSYTSSYADTGTFGVYAGCSVSRAEQVLALCRAELERAARDGITAQELARAKGQERGALLIGLEDTAARMTRLGASELVRGEQRPVAEELRRIAAVTLEDVAAVAAEVLRRPLSLAALGPFGDRDLSDVVA